MSANIASHRRCVRLILLFGLLFSIVDGKTARTSRAQSVPPSASNQAALPLNFERHTGDLDSMVKRGNIRALVLYSHSGFFYVNGKPEGIYYQALQSFEQ